MGGFFLPRTFVGRQYQGSRVQPSPWKNGGVIFSDGGASGRAAEFRENARLHLKLFFQTVQEAVGRSIHVCPQQMVGAL